MSDSSKNSTPPAQKSGSPSPSTPASPAKLSLKEWAERMAQGAANNLNKRVLRGE